MSSSCNDEERLVIPEFAVTRSRADVISFIAVWVFLCEVRKSEDAVTRLKLFRLGGPAPAQIDGLAGFFKKRPCVPESSVFAHALKVERNADIERPGIKMQPAGHVRAEFPDDRTQCHYLAFHGITVIGDAL